MVTQSILIPALLMLGLAPEAQALPVSNPPLQMPGLLPGSAGGNAMAGLQVLGAKSALPIDEDKAAKKAHEMYENGSTDMRWALTLTGLGVVGIAGGVYVLQHKPDDSEGEAGYMIGGIAAICAGVIFGLVSIPFWFETYDEGKQYSLSLTPGGMVLRGQW